MSSLTKVKLLEILSGILKVAYAREPYIRKFCNFKWRKSIRSKSSNVIRRKILLILIHCKLRILQLI